MSLWRQSAVLRGLSVKPGLGRWQTVQNKIKRHRTRRLIRICTVCLNCRKLRVKWNMVKSPLRTTFPAYSQRQSTPQCYQCFDYLFLVSLVGCVLWLWHYLDILFTIFICLFILNRKRTANTFYLLFSFAYLFWIESEQQIYWPVCMAVVDTLTVFRPKSSGSTLFAILFWISEWHPIRKNGFVQNQR